MNTGSSSKISFGTEALGGADWGDVNLKDIEAAIHGAIDNGITSFDTASIYGLSLCETRLSMVLGSKINEIEIATKGGLSWRTQGEGRAKVWRDSSKDTILKSIDDSCERLGRSYLDIYYIHWPDENTLFSETFEALELAKEEGKIRHIGVSNFSKEQISRASQYADISYVQAPMNILTSHRNTELRQFCADHNINFVAYNILASGLLTDKYECNHQFAKNDRRHRLPQFQTAEMQKALNEIKEIQKSVDWKEGGNLSLSISWALAQKDVKNIILGIKSLEQLQQNLKIEKMFDSSDCKSVKLCQEILS